MRTLRSSISTVGIRPPSATCEKLGLADLPASYAQEGKRFAALRDAIVAKIGEAASGSSRGGPQCVGGDEARAVVQRELDSHGYGDWTVMAAGGEFSGAQPCADVFFDGGAKTVFLTPGPSRLGARG
jgi:hypothetical protein